MKQLTIFILLLAAGMFAGCKKYLDITPKGYVIPSNVEDYERILNGDQITRPLSVLLDQLSDDYYNNTIKKNDFLVNPANQAYMWRAEIFNTPDDYQSYSFYHALYANIYQFNAVINGIDAASGGSPARKAAAKARAQLGRAYSLWYLVNLYAKPYQAATAATEPGVSLISGNDINLPAPKRSSVQAVYDFILKDLNEAIPALPLSAPDPFQMTKGAGYGVLARTYLTMNDYTRAAAAATEGLTLNNKLLDYNGEFATYTDKGLNFIYAKQSSLLQNDPAVPENILVRYYTYPGGMSQARIPKETEQLFEADDLRRLHFAPTSFYDKDPSKWDGIYYYNGSSVYSYSMGIATPELFLIRAEANARSGKIQEAMNDVNTLRKYRIKTDAYADLTATTALEATKVVLSERRKEFLFKGLRWFDMRRLNSDPDFGFTAKHYFADGSFITLEPNSPRYVLRLPETAITSEVTQNP